MGIKKWFMVGICVVLLLAFTFTYGQQQTQKEPVTKLEQFLAKKGKIIIKEWREAGVLPGESGQKIIVYALTIYEPGKETDKIRGLRIEVYEGGKLERSNASFLDMDEVESLYQAINYMITLLENWQGKSQEYTEVIFSTKGDFRLGFYQKDTQVRAFAQSGTIGTATCFFSASNLSQLKGIIETAKFFLAQ